MTMSASAVQLSVAVAVPVEAGSVEASHSTVTSAGRVIAGGVLSWIVIVWSQVAESPQGSVAVHVRVITPVLPQAGAKLSV